MKLNCGPTSILLFNIYFPCSVTSCEYKSQIGLLVGFIEKVLINVAHTDSVILGVPIIVLMTTTLNI